MAPTRVCVKTKELRKQGYDNLQEWTTVDGHVLLTRRGRVFVHKNKEKFVFHYVGSKFANPYKVSEYGLQQCLALYELIDETMLNEFKQLNTATQLGCFCEPHSMCHVDVVLSMLSAF